MTTVFRLPEEPPVGTTVRPEPDTGERYKRINQAGENWLREKDAPEKYSFRCYFSWARLFDLHRESDLVKVEPDPHPTPWRANPYGAIFDAAGSAILQVDGRAPEATAARIVKAVNEAAS